ncbi:hypothetical protein [Paenibacillus sp. 37]|uniref:hypothetical protein n=1 Tax=Paenibacillus sp. 37 TaxID=2607911 RepID=UPI0016620DCB|nr:hypothetical protein [Paenibacillus sp. 37]
MQILLQQRSAQGCNEESLNVYPRSYDIQGCGGAITMHCERLSRIALVLMFKRIESWQTILSLRDIGDIATCVEDAGYR